MAARSVLIIGGGVAGLAGRIGRRERQGRHQEVNTLLGTGHAAMAAHI
jgi:hypothetical protein